MIFGGARTGPRTPTWRTSAGPPPGSCVLTSINMILVMIIHIMIHIMLVIIIIIITIMIITSAGPPPGSRFCVKTTSIPYLYNLYIIYYDLSLSLYIYIYILYV